MSAPISGPRSAVDEAANNRATPRPGTSVPPGKRGYVGAIADQGLFPPVEPPAAVAARLRPHWRQWCLQRWHETPCWLASLIIHLSVVITLGTLITPVRQTIGTRILVFVEGGGMDPEDQALEQLVSFEVPLPSDGPTALEPGGVPTLEPERPPATEPDDVATPEPDQQPATEPDEELHALLQSLSTTAAAVEQHMNPTPAGEVPQPSPDPVIARLQTPGEPVGPRSTPTPPRIAGASATDVTPILDQLGIPSHLTTGDRERTDIDTVVDRFIAFDVGRLAGQEALAARRDFEQLGPDAIQELVRGLNKSAYVSASCPVVVISNKLAQALAKTEDPRLIEYAIANIGRGVPGNAPFADRLKAFRDELIRGRGKVTVDSELARHGLAPTPKLTEQVDHLLGLPPQKLIRMVSSKDPRRAAAARVAITLRCQALAPDVQLSVAQQLTQSLSTADPANVPSLERTLCALYEELTGSPPEMSGGDFSTHEDWRQRWEQVGFDRRSRLASTLLAEAIQEEQEQRPLEAAQRYQRVVETLPDSQEADEAQRRLSELNLEPAAAARLVLAAALERRGATDGALQWYRVIVERFPGTPSAEQAKLALERLQASASGDR